MSGVSPQQKKDPRKKWEREEQGLKRTRGETSVEKLHVLKKREDEIYMLLGQILSKERKKGEHNFL
jgi:hypothetical protein